MPLKYEKIVMKSCGKNQSAKVDVPNNYKYYFSKIQQFRSSEEMPKTDVATTAWLEGTREVSSIDSESPFHSRTSMEFFDTIRTPPPFKESTLVGPRSWKNNLSIYL